MLDNANKVKAFNKDMKKDRPVVIGKRTVPVGVKDVKKDQKSFTFLEGERR